MANNHGGARKGAGRKPGKLSEAKRQISEEAKELGAEALSVLAMLMRSADSESVQMGAAQAILDRGYGKPTQSTELSGPNGVELPPTVIRVVDRAD